MKKLGNRKRLAAGKTRFTIDLDIKGVVLFSTMAIFTAATVFYLGLIFGKASRQPDRPMPQLDFSAKEETPEKNTAIPKDLAVFDINDDPQQLDKLKESAQKDLQKTDTVIEKTKEQETPTIIPVKRSTTQEKKKKWPEKKATADKKTANLYTIQVFVTKSREKANTLTRQLRQKNFEAYVLEVAHEKQKLYKIRVGRRSKEKVAELKQELQKVVGGLGMGLSVVKIG